jgi:PAS domain S-box-containing protein
VAREIRSPWLRYGLAVVLFAIVLGLSLLLQQFSIKLNLTIPVVGALVIAGWYGGLGPGILLSILFEAVTIYFAKIPADTTVPNYIFLRFSVLALYVLLILLVSGRRKAENHLREQREMLQVTLSSIGDAVIATDLDGRVTFINPTAETLTGWSLAEATGTPLHEVFNIVNEHTRETVESPFEAIKRHGLTVGLANHTIIIGKDGRETPIDDSGAPIRNPSGNVVGAVIVFHDVSERRAAEHERERLLESEKSARRAAESSDRLKDEFLATVSHELRTPLNSILGWAAMLNLKDSYDEKSVRNAIGIIERNARAQSALINDILDVSRIITGKLQIRSKRARLGPVVRAAIETLRPAIEAKAIRAIVSDNSQGAAVNGDPDRMQQVVWNLVSNAVKFTPQGGRIEVSLDERDEAVEISVRDSGVGIDKEFLPFVFERFRQADSSAIRSDSGLGLGLSIVRHLVEMHGGTVTVQSEGAGKGALFAVILPRAVETVKQAHDEADSETRSDVTAAGEGGNGAVNISELRGVRVLVVDDDPDTLEILCIMLTQFNVEVAAAASSMEAIKLFDKWRPDVLISDLAMPGEDGFSFIKKIRALPAESGGETPAAALSAYAGEEDHRKALEAGFHTHVAKPVDPQKLASTVRDLVARRS